MDNYLLGHRRDSMLSRPPADMRPLMPPRLSQESLHQLERNANANQSLASSRDSRIQHWVHGLAQGTNAIGNSLVDFGLYHENFPNPFDMTTQYAAGFGQPSNYGNTIFQGVSNQANNNTGHTFRPEFTFHPPAPPQQLRTVHRTDFSGNNRLPGKAMPMADHTLTRNGSTSQPPTKKVFTGKQSQEASASVDLSSIVPVVEPVAAKFSSQTASSAPTPTLERRTTSQQKEEQQAEFREKIQTVFPDLCEEYVKKLYAKYEPLLGNAKEMTGIVEQAIEEIIEQPSYPKKIQKKRKQMADSVSDNDVKEIQSDPIYYFPIVVNLLHKQFTSVPKKTIKYMVAQYKTLFKTYMALFQMGPPSSDASDYWTRLYQVKDQHPPRLAEVLEHEMQAVKKVLAQKEDAKRKENEDRQEKINEEEHRRAGALVECQCCFSEVPQNRIIPCEGEEVHWFCNSCFKTRAETQVGQMQYELKCFDMSGCSAAFNTKNVRIVLGDKLMKRLEDLQQMDEVAKASIDGLEECPFCEFKAICPPVEQDKEFNCQNPDCERISCRLCKEESHIPLSCEEAKADRATHTRHIVEEAMTNALIRKCPKCKVPIIKEDGCNKLKCGRCGTLICDVCKKDISNTGYEHFSCNECPLHEVDKGAERRMKEVTKAEIDAVNSIVTKDRSLDPALLRVSKQQQSTQNLARQRVSIVAARPMPMPPTIQMPTVPTVPNIPAIPRVPAVPKIPPVPKIPAIPQVPIPKVPAIPKVTRVMVPPLPRWAAVPPVQPVPPVPTIPTVPKLPSRSMQTTYPHQQLSYRTTTLSSKPNLNQNHNPILHAHPHPLSQQHLQQHQHQHQYQYPQYVPPGHGHGYVQQQQQQHRTIHNVSHNPNQTHRQI